MCKYISYLVLFLVVVSPAITSLAASGGEESAEDGGAEKEKSQDNGYDKKLTKFNTYQSEIKTTRSSIQNAMKELKRTSKASPRYKELTERVVLLHEDLELSVKNYNAITDELRYRFPEKSEVVERKYLPYRKQSLKQIERELDLDDILSEAGRLIDKKYRIFLGEGEDKPRESEIVQKSKKKSGKDLKKNIEVVF